MSELSKSVRRRLQKIAQLAERGVGGEKAAAQAMLDRQLRKHGITLADLDVFIKREWTEISTSSDYDLQLLEQVIHKVTQQNDFDRYRNPEMPFTCWYELTQAEHEEVKYLFQIMRVHLHAQFEKTLAAFIQANSLFASDIHEGGQVDRELTPEEHARHCEISSIVKTLSPVEIFRGLK
jgi:hypothetical protein